jgi:iron complex transport system substrate-binding protein
MPRIVSLVPSYTEVLCFLGLEANLAGVTEHCDFPETVKSKDKAGTFGQPLTDRIISLKPDLVMADAAVHGEAAAQLRSAGIEVIAFTPACVEDIFWIMDEIAKRCFIEAAVRPLIDSLRERVCRLTGKSSLVKPRVFRVMSTDPLITPGPGSFQYDTLQKAGAKLLAFQTKDPYIKVQPEQVAEFDPEVILFCGAEKGQKPRPICVGCAAERPPCRMAAADITRDEWLQTTAFRENRVYPITCDMICRPGPRLIAGMEKLHSLFFGAGC